MNKRMLISALGGVALLAAAIGDLGLTGRSAQAEPTVEIWKSPTCGCCEGWVDHIKAAGFAVKVHDFEDMDAVKKARGVPEHLGSCHTAVVDGYVIEGHVPASDVKRLLTEKPQAKGLSAPGMPADAPGMDMKTGQPYQVMLFGGAKGAELYAKH